jgi:methyltransferase of ATP-grasp peptide maturase system
VTDTAVGAFISDLSEAVTPLDQEWVTAFENVPRGLFVAYFFHQGPPDWRWRTVEPPDPEWSNGVFSRQALIVQLDGDDAAVKKARHEPISGIPTSSSSAPTLMAAMLQALDVRDGDRVLEIGSGTGYNAGLLCHRLGADRVTSIDVDPSLVDAARARLASIGYHPHLETADGVHGAPGRAPFDKIIATVALPGLPPAWREQTVPGGTILLPLDLNAHGGLIARLDVDAAGVAQGRFLSDHGYFMSVRERPLPKTALGAEGGESRSTTLPIERVRVGDPFDEFAALRTAGFGWTEFVPGNGDPAEVWLTHRDGSWVCHSGADGRMQVRQGGPRRLWDEVEAAFDVWQKLGEPTHDRFGLTVTPDGQHRVWLDEPDGAHTWELPTD